MLGRGWGRNRCAVLLIMIGVFFWSLRYQLGFVVVIVVVVAPGLAL